MGSLIDTCIWIDVERGTISPADVARFTKEEPVFISPVILAELCFGAEMAKDERIRQKRLAALSRLRKKPFIIIDENTVIFLDTLRRAFIKKALIINIVSRIYGWQVKQSKAI